MITAELNYDSALWFYGDTNTIYLLYTLKEKIERSQCGSVKLKIEFLNNLIESYKKDIISLKTELKNSNNNLLHRLINKNINKNVKEINKKIKNLEAFIEYCINCQIDKLEGQYFLSGDSKGCLYKNMLATLGFSYKIRNKNQAIYEYDGDEELLKQQVNLKIARVEKETNEALKLTESKLNGLQNKEITSDDIYRL